MLFRKSYQEEIISHYEKVWHNKCKTYIWDKGPFQKLPPDFRVLEFAPNEKRKMWTYSTCCMSQLEDDEPIELHIFSSKKDEGLIELLTAVAYYHRQTAKLNLNHTVNFGRPWQDASLCTYGFISLPYLDGPTLENFKKNKKEIKFYWLIPITEQEIEYKAKNGSGALESKFEESELDYINPARASML